MTSVAIPVPLTITRKHSNGTIDVYRRYEELGHGGFATVYRVTNEDGQDFALKATSRERLKKPKVMQKHRSEVAIQRSLNHPNILKFYDFFEDSHHTYMVLELCTGRSVRDLVKRKGHLSETQTAEILRDVLEGLCYLHDNRIIHRDLKLENFLIGGDGKVRISDFGLSAKLDYDDERKFTVCGTPNYLSPELLLAASKGHSYEVDIWAIGVCAFAMLTGHPPFETRHTKLTYEHIKNCQYSFPPELRLSSTAKDFIRKILQIQPEKRPSAYELQQHPFITREVPEPVIERQPLAPRRPVRANENLQEQLALDPKLEIREPMPTYCVSRFCDHSEKYGLGYLLMDGTVGACFNDYTRMVMDPFEEFIQYWESYQDVQPQILKKDDRTQAKKLSILQKFAESLKKTKTMFTLPAVRPNKYLPMRHVKYWMRNDDATLFRMDDRNIQVNFNDRVKMMIFWSTKKMMCVSNIKDKGELIPLEELTRCRGMEDEKRRFIIAKAMISEMSAR